MEIREVDPRLIEWPEVRVTSYMNAEQTALFQGSMGKMGQVSPILALEADGRLIGVDGFNRCGEAIAQGIARVKVAVVPGEEKQVYLQNLATSVMRGKPKVTELIAVVKELTQVHGMDSDQLHQATGMPRDYIERLWTISEANEEILQALDEDIIGVTHAYMIARIPELEVQLRVLDQQKMHRWTVARLREHIDSVMRLRGEPQEPRVVEAPAPQRQVVCQFCREPNDPTNIAHVPVCTICSGAMLDAIRRERQAEGG